MNWEIWLAQAASPARYAVERGDWNTAATLDVQPTQFAHVEAITHFARALGAARSSKSDAARAEIAKLVALRDKLREQKNGYWAEQVEIEAQVATAWALNAEGKGDEAGVAAYADRIASALTWPSVHAPFDFDLWWRDVAEAVRVQL